jgi:hypothetical protein
MAIRQQMNFQVTRGRKPERCQSVHLQGYRRKAACRDQIGEKWNELMPDCLRNSIEKAQTAPKGSHGMPEMPGGQSTNSCAQLEAA